MPSSIIIALAPLALILSWFSFECGFVSESFTFTVFYITLMITGLGFCFDIYLWKKTQTRFILIAFSRLVFIGTWISFKFDFVPESLAFTVFWISLIITGCGLCSEILSPV